MRILVLTKRQYTNKDLIDDRYGRLYELPKGLADLGNSVTGLCLSYRLRDEGHLLGPDIDETKVNWLSINLGKIIIPGLLNYLSKLDSLCKDFRPDLILSCSDAPHIIQGVSVAQKYSIPCILDLYDNFESFTLTRIPGIFTLFKRAIKNASGIVAVSNSLKAYIEQQHNIKTKIKVIPNGFPAENFHSMNQKECRMILGLPLDGKLIGTAGALGSSRGTETMFKAAQQLISEDSSIYLILAGPLEPGTKIPEGPNIKYLGEMDYSLVPFLFNALDMGIVCNRESAFGHYCFPQKAGEMIACRLPTVAANVGTMSELFKAYPEYLYSPENQHELYQVIRKQLFKPKEFKCITSKNWAELAKELEDFIFKVVEKRHKS